MKTPDPAAGASPGEVPAAGSSGRVATRPANDLSTAVRQLLNGSLRQLDSAGLRDALRDLYEFWLTTKAAEIGVTSTSGFAIVATGGLGRGELAPYSDLDLTLVHDDMPADVVAGVAESLWYPLWDANIRLDHSVRTVPEALSVANEDISAGLFMRTLRRCFLTGARATKLIVPPQGVDSFLLAPLTRALDRLGVRVKLNATVTQVRFSHNRVMEVELADRTRLTADWYLSALPPQRLTPLLPERVVTHYAYFQQLSRLSESPLVAVRLHLDQPTRQTQLILLEGKTFHWMIRHPEEERHEQTSVVWAQAVGEPGLLPQSTEELVRLAVDDMAAAFPTTSPPRILDYDVIRLASAMLAAKPGTHQYRPIATSPFTNFLVTGAWTDTGWPATDVAVQIVRGDER